MRLARVGVRPRALLAWMTTALATSGALAASSAAWAQVPASAPPTAGLSAQELNPAARAAPLPPPRDADVFAPEPPGPCPLADSPVEVTLASVTFRGATALSPAQLARTYAGLIGKPQKVGVICEIRDRAARALFDHGVLARVEIPEQRIAGGALILDVIEAHVVNVRVRGDIGPGQAAVERYVEKLRGMKPFDMRKAQRYLLLASDVPGVRVRAAVKPSASPERGAVDIDVTVTRTPLSVLGNVQNMGARTVGRFGGLVRADARSYTQYGEDTTLVAFHTLDSNEQWVVQVQEAARLGGDGWIARASVVYGQSRPGDVLKPLDLKSTSVVAEAEAAYPLIRRRRANLNLAGGFDLVDQKTEVGGGGVLSEDRLRIFYLRADGDYRFVFDERPVTTTGSLSLRRGVTGLGATSPGSPLATRVLAEPDAWLVRGTGGLEAPINDQVRLSVRAQAQYAAKPLTPYEQISLGDLSVGRGYDPAVALGDSGAAAAVDLRFAPIEVNAKLMAAPFAFFDAGYVHNNDAGRSGLSASRSLRSIGAGVSLRISNRANLDLTFAYPLDSVSAGGSRPAPRLLLNLTASFL